MTISIAIVSNNRRKIKSTIKIGEIGAELKKKAKTIKGSIYYEDKRTSD